jgi:gluconate 5-dehydrogenase
MIQKLFDLSGKVVLITGGTHGIGRAIGVALGKAGATICINGRTESKLKEAVEAFSLEGVEITTHKFDVTNEAEVDKGISEIEKEIGTIDILVNNAAITKRKPILDFPLDEFKQIIEVDLIAPFIVSKRVAPAMIKKRAGKIINLCSMMSEYGRNTISAYTAAKGGLKLLTANMCCEWAKYNVQINGIGPGYIATSLTAPLRENGHPFNDLVMTRTPAARWGEPEDVGNAALFLASKASDFVNGHVLYVDGGILANFGYVKGENDV